MIALEQLNTVRRSLLAEQVTIKRTLFSTDNYATRLRSSLKSVDERIKKVNDEIMTLKKPEGR